MFAELVRYAHENGLVTEPGFSSKRVRWLIDLAPDGTLSGFRLASPSSSPKLFPCCPDLQQPEMLVLPSLLRRLGYPTALAAHFLVERGAVVVNWRLNSAIDTKIESKHLAFKALIELAARQIHELRPVHLFLSDPGALERLRARLLARAAKPSESVSFSINGQPCVESESWRAWWRVFRLEIKPPNPLGAAISLVTGRVVTPISTHPKIRGLGVGALPTGASLVSFDKPAFNSLGHHQGENAPFEASDATSYNAALNALLTMAPRFGQVRLVHWYDRAVEPRKDPFWALFDPSSQYETLSARERIREWSLEPEHSEFQRSSLPPARVHLLAVAGAEGRARVEGWEKIDHAAFARAVNRWFDDLEIAHAGGDARTAPPQGLESLLAALQYRSRAALESFEKYIAPVRRFQLPLWRAALHPDAPLPEALAANVIRALAVSAARGDLARAFAQPPTAQDRSERMRLHAHMALLRAYRRRQGDTNLAPDLNPLHPDRSYQCGRLAAQLGYLKALNLRQGRDADTHRFFGLVLVSPASHLEPLVWEALRHIRRLEASRPGFDYRVLSQLSSVWEALGRFIPQRFSIDEQTGFALGYYQQMVSDRAQRAARYEAERENQPFSADESVFQGVEA